MPHASQPQSSGYTSPFAHWSHAPALGTNTYPENTAVASHDPQHAQQQPQQQPVPLSSGTAQEHMYSLDDASAKQQELQDRLAALDTLDFPGEGAMFEGFGSPVQTRHPTSGHAHIDSFGNQLYNTEAPLPVDAPGATLSAPEEALLASMREMLQGGHHLLLVTMCSALPESVVLSFSVCLLVCLVHRLLALRCSALPACLQEDAYMRIYTCLSRSFCLVGETSLPIQQHWQWSLSY